MMFQDRGFLARTEAGAIVSLGERCIERRDQFRTVEREPADFDAGLTVADHAAAPPVMNRDAKGRRLALRAVALVAVVGGGRSMEGRLEAHLCIGDTAMGARKAAQHALAFA